jgi:DNA-directed RNA polymerase subunit RPC12/RpoP
MIRCGKCGAVFVAEPSVVGDVSCPRCGALAPPAALGLRAGGASEAGPDLYARVVCTHCSARLMPPRPVAAGQLIQCRKCNTIFAAPGGPGSLLARSVPLTGAEEGAEVLPPDEVIVRRRSSPASSTQKMDRRQLIDPADPDDGEEPAVPVRLVRNRRDRERDAQSYWIAVSLAAVCAAGLIGIVLLILFARPGRKPAAGVKGQGQSDNTFSSGPSGRAASTLPKVRRRALSTPPWTAAAASRSSFANGWTATPTTKGHSPFARPQP